MVAPVGKRAKKNNGCGHRLCVLVEPRPNKSELSAVTICRLCGAVRRDAFGRPAEEWGPPLADQRDLGSFPEGARFKILGP
jgi:hypothetical protein